MNAAHVDTMHEPPAPGTTALVVGFARTGAAVARVLTARGVRVVALDDSASDAAIAEAGRLGVELTATPTGDGLTALLERVDLVVASPGVPLSHPALAGARPGTLVSEVELAARLGGPPVVAITGTNGKTTVTSLVVSMLERSGLAVKAAGNIGYPLVEAVGEPGLDLVVAEVSSFQLALADSFRPVVAAWLNFAEDHLDWHRDLEEYAAAKARIWRRQGSGDVAVANAEDDTVMAHARAGSARLVTFGRSTGDFHLEGDALTGPNATIWARLEDLPRTMPHDVANALAAAAIAASAGARPEAVASALREQGALPHRVELVERFDGIEFYDDSKATTPSAVVAALAGFDSVVLIAGGRNKGLDLSVIAGALADNDEAGTESAASKTPSRTTLRGVVAIGEAAGEIEAAFAGRWRVERAESMDGAVAAAARLAQPGDAVLLSPGCASFDWYRSYEERGADFARAVRELAVATSGRS
jgi:UDP-N-acetylmuramoylalanine--D-glutamate ligase